MFELLVTELLAVKKVRPLTGAEKEDVITLADVLDTTLPVIRTDPKLTIEELFWPNPSIDFLTFPAI